MNRRGRRASAKAQGIPWRKQQAAKKFVEQAAELERKAIAITPEKAREMLGRWAAAGGHIPIAEVEREEQLGAVTLGDLKR